MLLIWKRCSWAQKTLSWVGEASPKLVRPSGGRKTCIDPVGRKKEAEVSTAGAKRVVVFNEITLVCDLPTPLQGMVLIGDHVLVAHPKPANYM